MYRLSVNDIIKYVMAYSCLENVNTKKTSLTHRAVGGT